MKKITIVFQGDSVTDGGRIREGEVKFQGDGLGTLYPFHIASRLLVDRPDIEWNIINRAISGNRIVDLYARWKLDAINLQPDILSILVGVNDTWHEFSRQNGVEVPRANRIYRELLEWTRQRLPNVKFVLMTPFVRLFGAVGPEWPAEVAQRCENVKALAEEFDAIFIDCQKLVDDACLRAPQEYWLRDGVHPTVAGQQLLADAWLNATASLF